MFAIYADGELIYFPADESAVLTKPALTLEMGKAGSLTFEMPPTNRMYGRLNKLKTVVRVLYNNAEIFRGRVLSEERAFNNVKTVYCEGDLSYLVDSVQKGTAYRGTTRELFSLILAAHNARVEPEKRFLPGQVTIEDRSIVLAGQSEEIVDEETDQFDYKQIAINGTTDEWQTTYDYLTTCLTDYCGGYLRTRHEGGNSYLDYVESYDRRPAQEIRFGVNLLDLTEEASAEEIFTVLIPLGDDNLTIESVNGGSDELVDAAAVAQYGRIIRTNVFDSVTDPQTLKENGLRYLQSHANIPTTVTVTAVDLNLLNPDIDEILVGDKVRVSSAPHGIGSEMTCCKIEYDIENPGNTAYTFGEPKPTLTERYKKDRSKEQESKRRGGGSGGRAAEALEEKVRDSFSVQNEKIVDIKRKIQTRVGLDIDADPAPGAPNINLYSLRSELDEHGNEIANQNASIQAFTNEQGAKLELIAADSREQGEHIAQLNLIANELESAIEAKADRVTFETSLFEIQGQVDQNGASIASFSSEITSINSRITQVRQLIADEIEAVRGNFGLITADRIDFAKVIASHEIYMNSKLVATREWAEQYIDEKLNTQLSSLPSHRHSVSISCSFGWQHKHDSNGLVNAYHDKTMTVSGNTGYTGS